MHHPFAQFFRNVFQRKIAAVVILLVTPFSLWGSDGGARLTPILEVPVDVARPYPKSNMGHYQTNVPTLAEGAYVPSFTPSYSKLSWFAVTASALHVFDTGSDIDGHTGWGGVIDASWVLYSRSSGFYFKTGLDFVYFQTDASRARENFSYKEETQSYKAHVNLGAGYRYRAFDVYGWFGAGFGATHTERTRFNTDRSHTSADFMAQIGARIAFHPTDYCSIYAGYRMMVNVPLNGKRKCYTSYDSSGDDWWWGDGGDGYTCTHRCVSGCSHDEDCSCPDRGRDYPNLLAHAFEVGVTFYF